MSPTTARHPAVLSRPAEQVSITDNVRHRNPFRDSTRFLVATIATGVLSGIGAIGFHYLADTFGDFLFAWAEWHRPMGRLPAVLVIPTIGLGLVGLVLQLIPEGR